MLPNVGSILGFVPFQNHCNSNCSYRQRCENSGDLDAAASFRMSRKRWSPEAHVSEKCSPKSKWEFDFAFRKAVASANSALASRVSLRQFPSLPNSHPMLVVTLHCGTQIVQPNCLLSLKIHALTLRTVDVRLGNPAHVRGQQSRGTSAGMGGGVGAGLALPQRLRSGAYSGKQRKLSARIQPANHRIERRILF